MKKMFLEKGNTALKLLFAAIFLFTSVFTIIPATIAQADGTEKPTQEFGRWGRLSSCYGVKFGLQGTTAEVTLNGNTPVWKAGENTSVPLSSIGDYDIKYVSVKTGGGQDGFFLYDASGEQVSPDTDPHEFKVTVSGNYVKVEQLGQHNISHIAVFVCKPPVGKISVKKVLHSTSGDTKPFTIRVTKLDSNGNPTGTPQESPVTGGQTIEFTDLRYGKYKVEEVGPPAGYGLIAINGQPATNNYAIVTVGETNTVSIQCIGPDVTFTNEKLGKITVTKAFKGTGGDNAQVFSINVKDKATNGQKYNETKPASVNNPAVFDNLKNGKYIVSEVEPANIGYKFYSIKVNNEATLFTNSAEVTVGDIWSGTYGISCVPDFDVDVAVTNQKLGKVRFRKDFTDGYTNTDKQFKIKLNKPDGTSEYITITGDSTKVYESSYLPWGKYSIEELGGSDMPNNFSFFEFRLNGNKIDPNEFTIGETTDKTFTITAVNNVFSELKIIKEEETTHAKLNDAVFEISNNDQFSNTAPGKVYTRTTVNGEIIMNKAEGFIAGSTWYVREKTPPPNYRKDTHTETVTLKPGTNTVTFANTPVGNIKVYKILENGGTDLTTVFTFVLSKVGEPAFRKEISMKAGENKFFDDLDYGQYVITETIPATANYKLLGFRLHGTTDALVSPSITVNVPSQATVEVDAINRKQGKLILEKDLEEGSVLTNPARTFRLHIEKQGSNPLISYDYDLTAGAAPIEINNFDYGTYTVQETGLTSGIELVDLFINGQKVTTQGKIGTFTVGAGEIPSLEITIKAVNKTWSKIKILKLNKDGSAGLPGAKFQISNNADFSTENGGIVIKDLVTDANGEINLPNILKVGEKWWAQETEAPAGYLLDSTSKYRVLEEGVNTFTFNNSLGGWIKIIKIDELTKLPLNGAVFELATNQGFTENYFTMTVNGDGPEDNNGEETTGLLKPGLWYVREKTAPSGYIKDNDIEPVNVVEGQITRVNFSNTPVGQIVVTKALDGNYSDPDTEFKITVTCGNPVYSRFQMVKGGKSVTFDSLPYGEYTVTETDPGTLGYKLLGYAVNGTTYNTASVKVTVGENNGANNTPTLLSTIASVIERSPWDQQVTVTNQKIAKLTLEKVFLNGWTNTEDEFTFTVTKVGGTPKTYKVKSGSPVELIGLDYGQYTIQETGMPEGYAFSKMYVNNVPTNDNPVTVTVGANNLDVKVKAENDKQIKLTVKKFDAWNPQKPLAGMHFVIADNDKFEKLPGGIYIEDETNDKGEFTTSQYFPYGTKLWVKETVPPTDYLIDPNPQSITLTYTENVVTFKDPPVNHCWIKIFKLDADTQKPLNGARFEVANNADFKDSFFMDITANGEATTNDLTPGDWWVREDKAPAGYIKDTSVQKITVAWHETKPVTFTNRHGGFVIWKKDSATFANLTGAEFDIYNSADVFVGHYAVDAEGKIPLSGFAAGTYKAIETKAPTGYKLLTTPTTFTIVEGQSANVIILNTAEQEYGTGWLKIRKVDASSNKALKGAKFDIYNSAKTTKLYSNLVTNASGEILVEGMDPGDYYIKETAAPSGYKLVSAYIKVTVVQNQITTITVANTGEQDYQTGTDDYNMIVLGGILLIAGAAMIIFYKRRKVRTN